MKTMISVNSTSMSGVTLISDVWLEFPVENDMATPHLVEVSARALDP
jgi:hypothetical protein